jgi:hypothetical protein
MREQIRKALIGAKNPSSVSVVLIDKDENNIGEFETLSAFLVVSTYRFHGLLLLIT